MRGLTMSNVLLNRKMLSELAINEPYSFKAVLDYAKVFLEQFPQPPVQPTVKLIMFILFLMLQRPMNPVKEGLKWDPRRKVHGITPPPKRIGDGAFGKPKLSPANPSLDELD